MEAKARDLLGQIVFLCVGRRRRGGGSIHHLLYQKLETMPRARYQRPPSLSFTLEQWEEAATRCRRPGGALLD